MTDLGQLCSCVQASVYKQEKMAEACVLQWVPETLYNSAISSIVTHYHRFKRDVKVLPENVLFDIFCKVFFHRLRCVKFVLIT
jgi:hypothetical protein